MLLFSWSQSCFTASHSPEFLEKGIRGAYGHSKIKSRTLIRSCHPGLSAPFLEPEHKLAYKIYISLQVGKGLPSTPAEVSSWKIHGILREARNLVSVTSQVCWITALSQTKAIVFIKHTHVHMHTHTHLIISSNQVTTIRFISLSSSILCLKVGLWTEDLNALYVEKKQTIMLF